MFLYWESGGIRAGYYGYRGRRCWYSIDSGGIQVIFYRGGVVRIYSMWVVFYLEFVWVCDGIVLASK